jgi:hypothetical protein
MGRPHNEDVERWKVAARSSRIMRHQFLIERSIAWLGHFGSRSLVALAVVARIPLLATVALLTFAITDGFAAYEHRRQVDWFSAAVIVRYFRVAAIVLSVELAVLAAAIAMTR